MIEQRKEMWDLTEDLINRLKEIKALFQNEYPITDVIFQEVFDNTIKLNCDIQDYVGKIHKYLWDRKQYIMK